MTKVHIYENDVVQGSIFVNINIVLIAFKCIKYILATLINLYETWHHEVSYPDNEHFANGRNLSCDISFWKKISNF